MVGATGGVVLAYDPLGRLHQVSSTAGPTTQFLYDGQALVAEYVSGTMTRRYVHGVGADVPLLSYAGSNLSAPSYLHADERGSIVAISDAYGNGSVNSYDEYGIPGAGNTGRFQYTGQTWLPELGMYYYKARIYSPTLGRFMQTDPIGYAGGMNLYGYVVNDPINLVDPMGTCPKGTHLEYPTGSHIGSCVPDGTSGGTGLGTSLSGFTINYGTWYCTNCGGPAGSAPDAAAVVTAPHWVFSPGGFFGLSDRFTVSPFGGPGRIPVVSDVACAIGRLGADVEDAGQAITTGGQIVLGIGVITIGASIIPGLQEAAPLGLAIAGEGLQTMAMGGAISIGGAVMRGIGTGDIRGAVIRSVNRTLARRLGLGPLAPVASGAANSQADALIDPPAGECG